MGDDTTKPRCIPKTGFTLSKRERDDTLPHFVGCKCRFAPKREPLLSAARYLPESEAGCDAPLRLGAIALYLSHSKIESPLGLLAKQALCRYGLQAFASLSGLKLSCKTRRPYERIAPLCKEEPETSPFRQIFLQEDPSKEFKAQVKEALKGLPSFVSQYFLATLPDWLEEQQRFKMESGGNEGAKAQNILIRH